MNLITKEKIYKWILSKFPAKFKYRLSHYRMHRRFGNHTYRLNIKDPLTFNEKISWLKQHHRFELGKVISDKLLVRDYIKKMIGEECLIPVLDVYDRPADINYNELPKKFVLKPNHGSGWVLICTDKERFDMKNAKEKLSKWLNLDFYYLSGEWQYRGIDRKIICEKLIEELEDIMDYKFFCFNGIPKFIQVDMDRHASHKRSFYDLKWNKMDFSLLYPNSDKILEKPENLDCMVEIATKLCSNFTFCRVDLYHVNGKIYFGEITLHPGGGNEPFGSYHQDLEVGKMLSIDHLRETKVSKYD